MTKQAKHMAIDAPIRFKFESGVILAILTQECKDWYEVQIQTKRTFRNPGSQESVSIDGENKNDVIGLPNVNFGKESRPPSHK